jgi:hypothetical protein
MRAAIGVHTQQAAFVVLLPFISLHLADGLWKPILVAGPTIYFWAYDLFTWVVVPVVCLAALHKSSPTRSREYGLAAPLGWADVLYVLPLPLIATALAQLLSFWIAWVAFGYPKPSFSYVPALEALGDLRIVGTVYLAATAGLWESVFYIGLPWLVVSQNLGGSITVKRSFAVVSAIVFAVAHFESGPAALVGALVFQVVAVHWYFRLGTLWPIICAHALLDAYYLWP